MPASTPLVTPAYAGRAAVFAPPSKPKWRRTAKTPRARAAASAASAGDVTVQSGPNFIDVPIGGNDWGRGFLGLNDQDTGNYPIDAAVATSPSVLLNAINNKVALYALNPTTGNSSGTPFLNTTLEAMFTPVFSGTSAASAGSGFYMNWGWPSAIYDKIHGRFILVCASNAQTVATESGTGKLGVAYPATGTGAVYVGLSASSTPQSGDWSVWGMPVTACPGGEFALPNMVQVWRRAGRGKQGRDEVLD